MNSKFFAEKGITSTSATHLAEIAKNLIIPIEEELASASFYDTTITLIGADVKTKSKVGKDGLFVQSLESRLNKISEMHSFNAWMREAVKHKDDLLFTVRNTNVRTWCQNTGRIYPSAPIFKEYTKEDAIDEMSVKERAEYLMLKAIASTYGSYIHPKGALYEARKDFHKKINNPCITDGKGRDLVVYEHRASVAEGTLTSVFESLQAYHRNIEKRFNCIEAKLNERVRTQHTINTNKYYKECDLYKQEIAEMNAKFHEWQQNELAKIGELKIAIPDSLRGTYDYLNSLGGK